MIQQISVPKPCHENWNNMQPEEQGKHCQVCSQTVIDFSAWSQQQILDYLKARSNERVCGRFNTSQVAAPPEDAVVLPLIFRSNLSILKKIAAIVLLCFGVACNADAQQKGTKPNKVDVTETQQQKLMGEPAMINTDTATQVPATDTLANYDHPMIMGKIAPPQPPVKADTPKKKTAAPKPKTRKQQ